MEEIPPLQLEASPSAAGDWLETTAVVYLCEWKSDGWLGLSFDPVSDQIGHYVVFYSYSVDGEPFDGRFTAEAPFEDGDTFKILFDPKKPSRNTGGDLCAGMGPITKVFAYFLSGLLVVLLLWVQAKWLN